MEETEAQRRGLEPLGIYRGIAVAGCAPDEMGIGPVFAVPKLLQQHGLKIADIDLWELNEAFACQVIYCRDRLGIPHDKLNVNGGAISSSKRPACCAAAVRCCERSEYSSCASRETP